MTTSVAVLGPVNVDYFAQLSLHVDEALLTFPTPYIKASVQRRLGGKGAIAALAAQAAGLRPTLFACIGGGQHPDDDGRFLIAQLENAGLAHHLQVVPGFSTSKVFLAYFAGNEPRLMICDNDVIFQLHGSSVFAEAKGTGAPHNILYISAYLALEKPSRDTVRVTLLSATTVGILTIVDLVPHDIVKHVGATVVTEFVDSVSILAMAPVTLRHLFPEHASDAEAIVHAYSRLQIRERLVIIDKIGGTVLTFDGKGMEVGDIGSVARDAPASGAGESAIFRIAREVMSSKDGAPK